MLEKLFQIKRQGSTVRREVVAGLTTFAAMAYILAVNPDILAVTGMDRAALITATALASAVGTLLMAFLTNYPIALAPGMGLNAFFAFSICLGMNVPWQGALGMVFWSGVLFLALSVSGIRSQIVRAIPECLKTGIQAGIGIFIAFLGLQWSGLVVNHEQTLVTLGPFSGPAGVTPATLALGGILLVAVLMALRVPGAILIGVFAVTVAGIFVPAGEDGGTLTQVPTTVVDAPASLAPLWFHVDFAYPFTHWKETWVAMLGLLFVDMFDGIGTLIGVSRRVGITDSAGEMPKMKEALVVDSLSTSVGACLGTSPVTPYIESAAGVESGGRTGLTCVVVAACFVLAMFFHPLIAAVPQAATAPALFVVGVLMMAGLKESNWSDLRDTVPMVATTLIIPFGFGIANGIAIGCILYAGVSLCSGAGRRVHWLLYVLAVLFALKFLLVGSP